MTFTRADTAVLTPAQLAEYAGNYRSDEVEATHNWRVEKAQLVLYINDRRIGVLEPTYVEPMRDPGDWREATLNLMRGLILEAVPDMVEERTWKKPSNGMKGVPVWSHGGIVCTGETYTNAVKLTFARGRAMRR